LPNFKGLFMSCIDFFRSPRRICVAALCCAIWPGPAHAVEKGAENASAKTASVSPSPAETPWPESDTVLDLLRADAQAAAAGKRLERAQDWLAAPRALAPPAASSAAMPAVRTEVSGDARDRLDVVAIYGVGQSLYADIAINGELWRYRQGRRWPQGIDDAASEPRYSLVRIEQPCVRLRWQEAQRTACLRREGARHD
jgi:type IV pilus biogenesis protein PilP